MSSLIAYRFTTEVMVEQIHAAKQEGAEGIVIFNYPSLTDEDMAVIKEL